MVVSTSLKSLASTIVFDLAVFCVWRNDQNRADAFFGHFEGIAAHKDLFEAGSAGDAHDHQIDALVANVTAKGFHKGKNLFP